LVKNIGIFLFCQYLSKARVKSEGSEKVSYFIEEKVIQGIIV